MVRPGLAVSFLVPAAVAMILSVAGCGQRTREPDPRLHIADGSAVIDLGGFGAGRGDLYHYITAAGKRVDILVCRESSGLYRAWLDACRECYRWRKGYSVDGDTVVCRRCGERFEIDRMEEGRGSCVPITLPSSVSDGKLFIPVEALEDGARYF